ncbi:MAG: PTS sugar transporter subunit IIA [bacterium]
MRLTDIIYEQCIKIPLQKRSKRGLIKEMVDLLADAGKIADKDKVLEAVLERERLMSTGVGNGVAIPHGKSDGVDRLVAAFGKTAQDVDFQSLDHKPVRLIFLLVGPEENPGLHIKALSRISRLTSHEKFRQKLLNASSPADVMRIITEGEETFSETA